MHLIFALLNKVLFKTLYIMLISEINANGIKGNWIAYFGCFKGEDTIQKGMNLTLPNLLFIHNDKLKMITEIAQASGQLIQLIDDLLHQTQTRRLDAATTQASNDVQNFKDDLLARRLES